MALRSFLYLFAISLLVHSGYSAHEVYKLEFFDSAEATKLPSDIILEALIAVGLMLFASLESVKNKSKLTLRNELVEPDNAYLDNIHVSEATKASEKLGFSDFDVYENRIPFINIREKRKEYSEWLLEK